MRWLFGGVRAATGDVNRARLRELGFELGARAERGESVDLNRERFTSFDVGDE